MSKNHRGEIICDECGGWDVEWMYKCSKHGADYCRGCGCPACDEENQDMIDDYPGED